MGRREKRHSSARRGRSILAAFYDVVLGAVVRLDTFPIRPTIDALNENKPQHLPFPPRVAGIYYAEINPHGGNPDTTQGGGVRKPICVELHVYVCTHGGDVKEPEHSHRRTEGLFAGEACTKRLSWVHPTQPSPPQSGSLGEVVPTKINFLTNSVEAGFCSFGERNSAVL